MVDYRREILYENIYFLPVILNNPPTLTYTQTDWEKEYFFHKDISTMVLSFNSLNSKHFKRYNLRMLIALLIFKVIVPKLEYSFSDKSNMIKYILLTVFNLDISTTFSNVYIFTVK